MKVVERNVQEIGKSLLVSLPKNWTKVLGVRKGSKLKLLVSENGNLSVAPEFTKEKEKKEVTIPFDEHFQRRFFREYFYGNEKITIKLNKKLGEKDRKDLYAFLRRFMNVQIIEETESKIIIKCFKIDELSMEECLRRMYFLSKNIIDELIEEKNKLKIKESRDTMTKFYYMLVMQVRRFLSEGKFSGDKQIPIVRAMDIRMVAEKIQRMSKELENIYNLNEAKVKGILTKIKDYYSRSFNSFIGDNFEKSVILWKEGTALQKEYDKSKTNLMRTKKTSLFNDVNSLLLILRYSKEISMLVR